MATKVVLPLVLLTAFVHGNSLKVLAQRSALVFRAQCLPGATTCSIQAGIRYCANPGWKCCNSENIAPISATCCPDGRFAYEGTYCCVEGIACRNGETCPGCTPVGGTTVSPPVVPSLPATTPAPVSTMVAPPSYKYFTFTIVYYYWQLYYIYVETLRRSTVTSSTVMTTTTVSVYAANTADARSSFSVLSATISLPTPMSATFLPPLPSQTSEVALATPTDTNQVSMNTSTSSSLPPELSNAAGRVVISRGVHDSMFVWGAALVLGLVGFGVNLIL